MACFYDECQNDAMIATYTGIHQYLIVFKKPFGFIPIQGSSTAPNGTIWFYNGYGYFDVNEFGVAKRLQVLYIENLKKFKKTMFYRNSTFTKLNFKTYAMTLTANFS